MKSNYCKALLFALVCGGMIAVAPGAKAVDTKITEIQSQIFCSCHKSQSLNCQRINRGNDALICIPGYGWQWIW